MKSESPQFIMMRWFVFLCTFLKALRSLFFGGREGFCTPGDIVIGSWLNKNRGLKSRTVNFGFFWFFSEKQTLIICIGNVQKPKIHKSVFAKLRCWKLWIFHGKSGIWCGKSWICEKYVEINQNKIYTKTQNNKK